MKKDVVRIGNLQLDAETFKLDRRKRKTVVRGTRKKSKSAKKFKFDSCGCHDPTSITGKDVFQNNDLLGNILVYLDDKTILFSMLFVSKAVELQLTHEHVIRCAMANPSGMRRITSLVRLLQQGSIYTPSPLRILRISVGKRCERCNCKKTNNLNNFGLFLCRLCTKRITTEIKLHAAEKSRNRLVLRAIYDERCAKIVRYANSNRGLRRKKAVRYIFYSSLNPFRDLGEENVGPLLSFSKLLLSDSFDELFEIAHTSDPHRTKIPSILQAYKNFSPRYDHNGIIDHCKSKSLAWRILILWENGERTWESLTDFAEDDLESCLSYARKNNLLHLTGWKELLEKR